MIEFLLYIVFTTLTSVYHLYINAAAICVSTISGYLLQKYWTFRSGEGLHKKQLPRFLLVVGIGFVLNNTLLYLFVDKLSLPHITAKFMQLWIVLVWNFSVQKLWVFKR